MCRSPRGRSTLPGGATGAGGDRAILSDPVFAGAVPALTAWRPCRAAAGVRGRRAGPKHRRAAPPAGGRGHFGQPIGDRPVPGRLRPELEKKDPARGRAGPPGRCRGPLAPAPDHRALVERADDLRRLGVDQARGVEPPIRVVIVAPAVGEPLAGLGARDLAAELGLEAAAGLLRAGGSGPLQVAQLGLHVRLQRAGESGDQFHTRARSGERVLLVIESGSLPRDCRQPKGILTDVRTRHCGASIKPSPKPLLRVASKQLSRDDDGRIVGHFG